MGNCTVKKKDTQRADFAPASQDSYATPDINPTPHPQETVVYMFYGRIHKGAALSRRVDV